MPESCQLLSENIEWQLIEWNLIANILNNKKPTRLHRLDVRLNTTDTDFCLHQKYGIYEQRK